ncbi:MAG: NUDIX domain-containing protein [Maritimibacter sp.]
MTTCVVKACPVVIRDGHILAFHHPLAGDQIVKGTVEQGEAPSDAAIRELKEEAGVTGQIIGLLGESDGIVPGQCWHFFLCTAHDLAENWRHFCHDDGGHWFVFYWHPLSGPPEEDFQPPFRHALDHIRARIGAI